MKLEAVDVIVIIVAKDLVERFASAQTTMHE